MIEQIKQHSDFVEVNHVRLHYVEAGAGPAVILCHGFPELWLSWRHQIPALAAAGYRPVALDMRGHGSSDASERIEDYSVLHTVGDVTLLEGAGHWIQAEQPEAVNTALLRFLSACIWETQFSGFAGAVTFSISEKHSNHIEREQTLV
jgi:pimeloyl-ACP methyl ester carboxylesterase